MNTCFQNCLITDCLTKPIVNGLFIGLSVSSNRPKGMHIVEMRASCRHIEGQTQGFPLGIMEHSTYQYHTMELLKTCPIKIFI